MTSTIDTIHNRPNMGSDFGQGFNYDVWTPNSVVTLCNVPWNSDYRDIVYFTDQAALDNYLDTNSAGGGFVVDKLTYARAGNPVKLNLPFNIVYQYNYIRVYNPSQPIVATYTDGTGTTHTVNDVPRTFYYFVTNVRYLAPNTTELEVVLDVWQTFSRNVAFGNCYIEQGHIGIANENSGEHNGLDYLTVPESHDLGSDYIVTYTNQQDIINPVAYTDSNGNHIGMGFLITTTTSLISSFGTVDAPVLNTAQGSTAEGLPNGCEVYYISDLDAFESFVGYMASYPWVAQGIISIMAVPLIPSSSAYLVQTTVTINGGASGAPTIKQISGTPGTSSGIYGNLPIYDTTALVPNFVSTIMSHLPSRYANLKKFMTSPYCVIELTSYTGNAIVLKPELLNGPSLVIAIFAHLVPPNPQISVIPAYGNPNATAVGGSSTANNFSGEWLDSALFITNLPQFSITNNSYIEFMASNANRIPWSYSQAAWQQQSALRGNANQANIATIGIANQGAQNVLANSQRTALTNMQNQQKAVSALANAVGSGLQGLENSGPLGGVAGLAGGAVAGAVGTTVENHFRNAATDIANTYATASTQTSQGYAGDVRDANKAYADFAANGDYQNAVAGIQARVQDMKLLQPSVAGQSGGDAAVMALQGIGAYAKVKIPQPGVVNAIGEYWLRYGYAINRFSRMPSNYQCMSNFTYWKLKETYITSSTVPESFKQTIRGIFEKGVTVWSDPANIGNIDIADNTPLSGITL